MPRPVPPTPSPPPRKMLGLAAGLGCQAQHRAPNAGSGHISGALADRWLSSIQGQWASVDIQLLSVHCGAPFFEHQLLSSTHNPITENPRLSPVKKCLIAKGQPASMGPWPPLVIGFPGNPPLSRNSECLATARLALFIPRCCTCPPTAICRTPAVNEQHKIKTEGVGGWQFCGWEWGAVASNPLPALAGVVPRPWNSVDNCPRAVEMGSGTNKVGVQVQQKRVSDRSQAFPTTYPNPLIQKSGSCALHVLSHASK